MGNILELDSWPDVLTPDIRVMVLDGLVAELKKSMASIAPGFDATPISIRLMMGRIYGKSDGLETRVVMVEVEYQKPIGIVMLELDFHTDYILDVPMPVKMVEDYMDLRDL